MNKKVTRAVIHLVVIGMIFILPEVVAIGTAPRHDDMFGRIPYAKVTIFIAVFYLEYMIMRPAMPRRWLIAGSAATIAVGGLALYMIIWHVKAVTGHSHPTGPMMIRDLAMLMLTVGLSIAMRLSERLRNIEDSHRNEELKHLKSQLNPHFLFNSLNTVYALTEMDPKGAREAVHSLSTLLRYALYEADSPTVKLKREAAFITDYVSLMRTRLGQSVNVTLKVDISPDMEDADIAPMLFVTIVENAFKHGDKGHDGAYVAIRIAAGQDGCVECDVANSVDDADTGHHGGVGLENLRCRLALIYGEKGRLVISRKSSIFVAQLRINIS